MRASIAAEQAGIPAVSIVCEGFERQSLATGRGHGLDDMRLGVLVGHVDAQSTALMVDNFMTFTVDQIVAGLTEAQTRQAESSGGEPAALDVVATGNIDEVTQVFNDRGWSDGLPFIPPTVERVQGFIAESGHDPWRTIGIAKSSGRDMTIWSVAVNAVMAPTPATHHSHRRTTPALSPKARTRQDGDNPVPVEIMDRNPAAQAAVLP